MKQIIFAMLLSAMTTSLFAQNRMEDEKQIEAVVDAYTKSWNNHNYDDMKNYATEDCAFVNPYGMFWKDLKEVQYSLNTVHKSLFKNALMSINKMTTRFVTADVAIVHVNWHNGEYTIPNGQKMPQSDNFATLTLVKKESKWLLTAGQVTMIDAMLKKSDPALKMSKE